MLLTKYEGLSYPIHFLKSRGSFVMPPVEGAYCFGLVHPSVQTNFKIGF